MVESGKQRMKSMTWNVAIEAGTCSTTMCSSESKENIQLVFRLRLREERIWNDTPQSHVFIKRVEAKSPLIRFKRVGLIISQRGVWLDGSETAPPRQWAWADASAANFVMMCDTASNWSPVQNSQIIIQFVRLFFFPEMRFSVLVGGRSKEIVTVAR